jgi:hypothetical protein
MTSFSNIDLDNENIIYKIREALSQQAQIKAILCMRLGLFPENAT